MIRLPAAHLSLGAGAVGAAGADVREDLRLLLAQQLQHFPGHAADLPLGAVAGAQPHEVDDLPQVHAQHQVDLVAAEGEVGHILHGKAQRPGPNGRLGLGREGAAIHRLRLGDGLHRLRQHVIPLRQGANHRRHQQRNHAVAGEVGHAGQGHPLHAEGVAHQLQLPRPGVGQQRGDVIPCQAPVKAQICFRKSAAPSQAFSSSASPSLASPARMVSGRAMGAHPG